MGFGSEIHGGCYLLEKIHLSLPFKNEELTKIIRTRCSGIMIDND